MYLAPALYRQGQIYDGRGQHALARERYEQFVRLRKGADPELRPLVEHARARIARIRD